MKASGSSDSSTMARLALLIRGLKRQCFASDSLENFAGFTALG